VFIGKKNDSASDVELRSVSVFVHELHPDGSSGVFSVSLRNGEEGNEKLRQREIGSVGFVRMVEVKVRAWSFFGRTEAESVIDSPKGTRIEIEGPSKLKPANGKIESGKARVLDDFVISGPMFGEVNGKESVRDMSAHGGDVPEEKFEGRRPKFFWNVLENGRNPAGYGVENESLHNENLLKEI
jgi:hypothetical protein